MKRNILSVILLVLFYVSLFSQSNDSTLTSKIFSGDNNGISVFIDNNKNLVFTKVLDSLNTSKDVLYTRAKSYIVYNYNDANKVIQQDDKEAGTIIGKGKYLDFYTSTNKIKGAMGWTYTILDNYSLTHILRIDVKENRARIIIMFDYYDIARKITATNPLNYLSSSNTTYFDNLLSPDIKRAIINTSPITELSIENRVENYINGNKTTKQTKKFYENISNNDIDEEINAMIVLSSIIKKTYQDIENELRLNNEKQTNDNW